MTGVGVGTERVGDIDVAVTGVLAIVPTSSMDGSALVLMG